MERQADFVRSLSASHDGEDGEDDDDVAANPLNRVAILWRKDATRLKLEWMRRPWVPSTGKEEGSSSNSSQEELRKALQRLLSANEVG